MEERESKQIVIVGGGFGGIAAALTFAKAQTKDITITLVSDKPHFEYIPALYRVVTGRSPLEVCIPLREIFAKTKVRIVTDRIERINLKEKKIIGKEGSHYHFDYAILALGSETAYFNIPGLHDFSFGFKSITEALRLKAHIHDAFEKFKNLKPEENDQKSSLVHLVIVGAGASGVELAGELASYTHTLARTHHVPESFIEIDLIEAAPHILPAFPEAIASRVAERLRMLGVNIFVNRTMLAEEVKEIKMRGMTIQAETVIWTAGVKPNELYEKTEGFLFDKKKRILVDGYLRAEEAKQVFIVGDGASTEFSGMAQTAVYDGKSAARNILSEITGKPLEPYRAKRPYYSVPVGQGWAATLLGKKAVYGFFGWFLRRAADIRYFFSILPFWKAVNAFRNHGSLCESCPVCTPDTP